MILFPAIDIIDGKVVRLVQGKFDQVTEYAQDPVAMAKHWEKEGAQWLHVVDLDGAKAGKLKNASVIIKIARSVKIPIQTGGGIRTDRDVRTLLGEGIARVILGTKAVQDEDFLKQSLSTYAAKIAVSIDASNGFVAQRGWQETSNIKATDWAKKMERYGVKTLIYTDIAKDGMLTGPNLEQLKEMLHACKIPLIASGGVSKIEDIKELKKLELLGLIGAITGKAIYENKLDLKEALKIC